MPICLLQRENQKKKKKSPNHRRRSRSLRASYNDVVDSRRGNGIVDNAPGIAEESGTNFNRTVAAGGTIAVDKLFEKFPVAILKCY